MLVLACAGITVTFVGGIYLSVGTADACKPQLVLLSAGFDAHRLDPIGNLGNAS